MIGECDARETAAVAVCPHGCDKSPYSVIISEMECSDSLQHTQRTALSAHFSIHCTAG